MSNANNNDNKMATITMLNVTMHIDYNEQFIEWMTITMHNEYNEQLTINN